MHRIVRIIAWPFSFVFHIIALAGALILGYEGWGWLKTNEWSFISLNDALWKLNRILPGEVYDRLAEPTDIAGANEIAVFLLQKVPAGIFFLVTGLILMWVIAPLRAKR